MMDYDDFGMMGGWDGWFFMSLIYILTVVVLVLLAIALWKYISKN